MRNFNKIGQCLIKVRTIEKLTMKNKSHKTAIVYTKKRWPNATHLFRFAFRIQYYRYEFISLSY